MKVFLVVTLLALLSTAALSTSAFQVPVVGVNLAWDPPIQPTTAECSNIVALQPEPKQTIAQCLDTSTTTGYVISYGTVPGIRPTSVNVGMKTTHAFPALVRDKNYYFVVQAYNKLSERSPVSDELIVPKTGSSFILPGGLTNSRFIIPSP